MMTVGLTGGIGSGKTTVAKMFGSLGIPVYNADSEAKILMESNADLKAGIEAQFGSDAYIEGKLNRKFLAEKVFNNKDSLKAINALVHPAVQKHFKRWANKQDAPYVIQEAAVLFENEGYKKHDLMILVWAPEEIRIKRVMERDNASREDILARMKHQLDDSEKAGKSDYIIENIDLDRTRDQVRNIHRELLKL